MLAAELIIMGGNLARHDAPQLLWNATRRRLFMQWITSAPPPSADVSGTV